jgi:MFS superfamily sulfate permease-like transporter
LPQGVAFALLAGLPPQYGLYAAMIPPALSSLFGSSRHLISGPTNAVAILLFASLGHIATPGRRRIHRSRAHGDLSRRRVSSSQWESRGWARS